MSSDHILFFGRGYHLPHLIRARAGGQSRQVSISVLGQIEDLSRLEDESEYSRIVALKADAARDEWVDMAMAIHAAEPVTQVGTLSDECQEIAAEVGARLGVATHRVETVRLIHDKFAMRQRLMEQDFEVIPCEIVSSASELTAFAAAHGYPCVVKPRQGTASTGVSVIHGAAEVEAAFAKAAGEGLSTEVIAEAFLPGEQYSVEAFSEGGKHVVLAVTRKFSDPVSLVELGHVLPAPLDREQKEQIETYVTGALDALGVEFGPTHTEIVLTVEGPRIIETHLRLGGDDIWKLVSDATGVDVIQYLTRQCLGEQVLPELHHELADPKRATRTEAIWFASPPSAGVLVEVTGAEGPHPDGVAVEVRGSSGSELQGLQNSYSRLAKARAHAEDAETALALAKEAIGRLHCVTRFSIEHNDLL